MTIWTNNGPKHVKSYALHQQDRESCNNDPNNPLNAQNSDYDQKVRPQYKIWLISIPVKLSKREKTSAKSTRSLITK